jgi:asparagine synthase (glutamine-hydrolysing)
MAGMCGIAGIFHPTPGEALPGEALAAGAEAMSAALAHRGPDDSGLFATRGIALAHRRLSILDLSPRGAQPMTDPGGRFRLLLNGEIYNHLDLRRELPEPEGGWRSTSDTETLLAALAAWGARRTLPRLRGMFAFALWDARERALTLGRDPFGEKPLHYAVVQHGGERHGGERLFAFASELKALRAISGFDSAVDHESLALYLRFAYVPEPRTIYRAARKLPPGCLLTVHSETLREAPPEPERWFEADALSPAGGAEPFRGTEAEALDGLERVLARAVERQLLADVPLGALLSGGVDSSLVVALMRRLGPVKTFTIGYDDPAWDESADAAAVAAHLGTEHTTLTARPEDALALAEELPRIWDEPFADPSALPTALVCRLTREHVTVALSGDGGDELFAGYNRHAAAPRLWARLRRAPRPLRAACGALLGSVPPPWADALARRLGLATRLPGQKLAKLASVLGATDPAALYLRLCSCWPDPAENLPESPALPVIAGSPEADFTDWMRRMDARTYLPGDVLPKVDRAAMRFGLETRAPFLDPDVAAFALSLPSSLLVRGGRGKWPTRELLYRHVPRPLVDRPKMGFGVPLDGWLRGPLRPWAEELLAGERLRGGGLRPEPVRAAWARLLAGRTEEQFRLWAVLQYQAWREAWQGEAS